MRTFAFLFAALLLPAAPPPAPVRTGATALYTATRREGDSLRVWVSWSAARPAPRNLRLTGVTAAGREKPWLDSVRFRPVGPQQLMAAVAASRLLPATSGTSGAVVAAAPDRLRLREPGPDAPAPTDIPVTGAAGNRTYVLTDSAGRVLTRAWLRTGEVVRARNFGLELPLTLLRYPADFQAALPPMVIGGAGATSARLTVAATRELPLTDTFSIRQPGLYALRQGTTGPLDPLLVEDGGFPDVRTAPDLIRPLVYLTTAQERQNLYNAPDPKKATDRFWLDIAQGQPEAARGLIRTYYGRVAEANRLFSCHKPGWMTDRGMLWIVLGPPPRVEPTDDGEDWVYKDVADAGGTRFRFRRRPTILAPDQYELRRERGFETVWYAAAAQWRQGTAVTAVK